MMKQRRSSVYKLLAVLSSSDVEKQAKTPSSKKSKRKAVSSTGVTQRTTTPKKKKKTKKQANSKTTQPASTFSTDIESSHWVDPEDQQIVHYSPVLETTSDSDKNDDALHYHRDMLPCYAQFKVRGHPRPLTRHRTGRGYMYNPSASLQRTYREAVSQVLFHNDSHNVVPTPPLFSDNLPLAMTIVFRMKRPKNHFVGSKPGAGRLKATAPSHFPITRTDIDNLTKFVFDSLNEVAYQDDKQIMSLKVVKILDNDGLCRGSTEVTIRRIDDGDNEIDTMIADASYQNG